ncbi:SulP family inorganic anion transporter [Roseateles violae]|uniref:SulP family inorganic anion transporter n=1 Tax=Roseateles violae TaxID=3058042 RepID=A0ABT8DUP1_9BURK|nr:SulP family inorganic anion transporter [Pelomonas sp. PFR6]MDN3921833.1 SulP family inorganic anion transporter [Pelomonas sp. PFR6]
MQTAQADGPLARAKREWPPALLAALTTAAVQTPFAAFYGLLAFAPLGPDLAHQALATALFGTAAAHLAASLAGSRNLILGPRPATTLLVAGLLSSLMLRPETQLPDGSGADVGLLLALTAIGVALTGLLQLLLAGLNLARLAQFLPHPVRAGFVNGVAVLLLVGSLPLLLGLPLSADGVLATLTKLPLLLRQTEAGALLVGLVALALGRWPLRWRGRLMPAGLSAMLGGIACHQLLSISDLLAPGPTLQVPARLPPPDGDLLLQGLRLAQEPALWPLLPHLLAFAAAACLLCTLDSLLVAGAMDGLRGRRHDGRRELLAQGVSNVAAALVGGQPSAPALGRSRLHFQAGGSRQFSVALYGLLILLCLWLAPTLLGQVPMSALGASLLLVGLQMFDDWSLRAPRRLWAGGLVPAQRRGLLLDYLLMALVALLVIWRGVALAVGVGVLLAMLLFVRGQARGLLRSSLRGDQRRSIKQRLPAAQALLQREGRRIAVLELEGPLFFGTAEPLIARLRELVDEVDYLVLGLHRIGAVDGTGARFLLEFAADCEARGKHLLLAEWGDASDPRLQALLAGDVHGQAGGLRLYADIDQALQWAEDDLLRRERFEAAPQPARLSLAQTQLGQGLDAEELDWLAGRMQGRQHAPGERIFAAGDAGDALYVSIEGEIAVLLPAAGGAARRLALLAPGVILGELALLSGEPRSTEARAETALWLMRLERAAFEALRHERPALADKLLRNMSLQLSARLAGVTRELAAALAR